MPHTPTPHRTATPISTALASPHCPRAMTAIGSAPLPLSRLATLASLRIQPISALASSSVCSRNAKRSNPTMHATMQCATPHRTMSSTSHDSNHNVAHSQLQLSRATRLVNSSIGSSDGSDPHHPSSVPLYQTATFIQKSSKDGQEYDYTRSGNPTRTALELQLQQLELTAGCKPQRALTYTSGMAALHTVTQLLSHGEAILCGLDHYGGTSVDSHHK